MKLHNGFTRVLFLAGLASCSSLSAAIVTYSTTGVFNINNMSSETTNGVTLMFVPTPVTTVNANPNSFVGFGDIVVSTASTTLVALPAGLTLTINISQSVPTPGGITSLTGTLTGSISSNSSAAVFTPTSATSSIGAITYAFTQSFTALVPPTSNGGDVSIQGIVTAPSSVPEPGTTVSLLSGVLLLGVGALKIRQRS